MKRIIKLTDGSKKRFSVAAATRYPSDYSWDGRNQVCKATGYRFEHETLYRTARGKWVKHWRSNWQRVPEKWELISQEEAMRWLRRNAPKLSLKND